MVKGLPKLPRVQPTCEACILGKQHRTPIPKTSQTPTTRPLQLVHSDLCGPLPQKSLSGSRYILTFIDDYTHYSWVYFLAAKSETFEMFKHFKNMVERQTTYKLATLQTDRGGEYLSSEFNAYCQYHGIRRQLTIAHTPQQNGTAERKNRHLLETMRTLLFAAKFPTYLWEEALRTANYISNRVPTRTLYHSTPYERYLQIKPDISHFRLIGSLAYLHLHKSSKLEPKSTPMILVGYDDLSKAYRCFDYNCHKIIISRDVVFNENQLGIPAKLDQSSAYDDIFLKFLDTNLPTNSSDTYPTLDTSFPLPANLPSSPVAPSLSPTIPSSSSPPITSDPSQSILPSLSSQPQLILNPPPPISQPPRRSSRFRKQSVKLDDYILSFDHEDFDICTAELNPDLSGDNLTYAQASHHPSWQEAMHDEMCSILKNQTWDLVKLPPGKRAITAKWVYKTKPAFPGSAPRLKARLVA
jgi:hypothetical protein